MDVSLSLVLSLCCAVPAWQAPWCSWPWRTAPPRRTLLQDRLVVGVRHFSLGVSLGWVLHGASIHETPSHAANRLLAAADQAMFEVKRGRQLALAQMGVLNQQAARSVLLA